MAELTPMMKQYFEIKNTCKDYIVFYRLGDFYEMFFEDALVASKELELTLTGRDCGQAERAPMCGVPYHAYETYVGRLVRKGYKVAICEQVEDPKSAKGLVKREIVRMMMCGVPYHAYETYVGRLVRKGYKVAICEQVEDPKSAKGLVKREIVRMITPGTLIDASMLDENRNNFLSCAFGSASSYGVTFCDISTGEVYVTEVRREQSHQELFSEFGRFVPREVLLGGDCVSDKELQEFISKRLEGIFSNPIRNCSANSDGLFRAKFCWEGIAFQTRNCRNLSASGWRGFFPPFQTVFLRQSRQKYVYANSFT